MRSLRRVWALPLVFALGAGILFACGGDDDSGGTVPPSVEDASVDHETPAPVVEASAPETGAPDVTDASIADAEAGADAGADATIDAGTGPLCTGLGFNAVDISKLRIALDGTLFVLTGGAIGPGTLHRFVVSAVGCALTEDTTFSLGVVDVRDFDLDAAGNVYVLRSTDNGTLTLQKRDPATGAAGTTCTFAPGSNAGFGRLAVSPDGTKASSLFSTTTGADAGTGVEAFTTDVTTCTSTAWRPNVPFACSFSDVTGHNIYATGIRMDATSTWLLCDTADAFTFAGTTSTEHVGQTGQNLFIDLAFTASTLDFIQSFTQVERYNRTTGTFESTVDLAPALGGPADGGADSGGVLGAFQLFLMSDPVLGERFVVAREQVTFTTNLYRIADF